MRTRIKALCLLFMALAQALGAGELLVFAAASLSDALKELGAAYEKDAGAKVSFNFAGSNLLARQIIQGAPAGLFASADEAQMDRLQGLGLVERRRALLSNQLAVVALKDSPLSLSSAAGLASPLVSRIAVADPRAVPNGIYARQYLEKLGLWRGLEGRLITTENVRGSLHAVESGNADVVIVYRSDAPAGGKVKVLLEVPRREGPRISYPFAVLKASPQAGEARRFLDYLSSPKAMDVFLRYGFVKP